jgi:hypothetical protein
MHWQSSSLGLSNSSLKSNEKPRILPLTEPYLLYHVGHSLFKESFAVTLEASRLDLGSW